MGSTHPIPRGPSPNPLAQPGEALRGWVGPEPQSLEGWEQPVRLGCAERVGRGWGGVEDRVKRIVLWRLQQVELFVTGSWRLG